MGAVKRKERRGQARSIFALAFAPNLPTKSIPAKIAGLKLSRESPMGLGTPPLGIKILFESNPLKPRILARRLAVVDVLIHTDKSDVHARMYM